MFGLELNNKSHQSITENNNSVPITILEYPTNNLGIELLFLTKQTEVDCASSYLDSGVSGLPMVKDGRRLNGGLGNCTLRSVRR